MNDQEIEELKAYNNLLENYFRNTIIPQLYIDGELNLRKFSPPAMTQFDLSDSDIGKPLSQMKDNLRYPGILENIQYVMESKEILEKEIQTTDLRWYQMNIIPFVQIINNKTNGVIITFVEITDRIKDLKIQEKLVEENALLLDTISHDLKNPLTNIIAAVDLLKSSIPSDDEESTTILKMVDKSLSKMHKLILDLTDERKKDFEQNSDEELLNIENVLEDVRITLNDDILTTNTCFLYEIGISQIRFSRRKLRTVMFNLISNAIKFRSDLRQLQILIKAYREKDSTVISIRDNGRGMVKNKIDTIFEKYSRLDESVEGSGIGLFLVKEIVTRTGGQITVDSSAGQWTEFKVYLKAV